MPAANQADFLGQGTLAPPAPPPQNATPAQKAQYANDYRAWRIQQIRNAANQTANVNAPGMQNRATPQSLTGTGARPNGSGFATQAQSANALKGKQRGFLGNLVRDPVTAAILAAPYGVAAAGAAIPAAVGAVTAPTAAVGPASGAVVAGSTAATTAPAAVGAGATTAAAAAPVVAQAAKDGFGWKDGVKTALAAVPTVAGIKALADKGPGIPAPAPPTNPANVPGYQAAIDQGKQASASLSTAAQKVVDTANRLANPTIAQTPAQVLQASGASGSSRAIQSPTSVSAIQAAGASAPAVVPRATAIDPRAASVVRAANQQPAGTQPDYAALGSAAANRLAPTISENPAARQQQQGLVNQAANFQPDTSGIGRIESMQADTSGIGRLESFRPDTTSVNALDNYSPTNSQAGVANLEGFTPARTDAAISGLSSFNPANTQAGVSALRNYTAQATSDASAQLMNFRPSEALSAANDLQLFKTTNGNIAAKSLEGYTPEILQHEAGALSNYQVDRSGISTLQQFNNDQQRARAEELHQLALAPEGPSAAQAMLASQSDADKRTALALSRSGRGSPAAQAAMQRQGISEGAAIAGETRGQAATLRAQETAVYNAQRVTTMAASGQLLSQADQQTLQNLAAQAQMIDSADARQLQAKIAGGQVLTQAETLKVSAMQAAAQVRSQMDAQLLSAQQGAAQAKTAAGAQRLGGMTAGGQLAGQFDALQLSANQSAGQLQSNMDAQLLGARQSAGQLSLGADQTQLSAYSDAAKIRSQMDSQLLSAAQSAGQLRLGNDSNSLSALTNASAQRLTASQINQQGAIAASGQRLEASGQQIQALSVAGQISSNIRNADIDVLKANLNSQINTTNMNDTQVRAYAQLDQDRKTAADNLTLKAAEYGYNATAAQADLDIRWASLANNILTGQQNVDQNATQLAINNANALRNDATTRRGQTLTTAGVTLQGISRL